MGPEYTPREVAELLGLSVAEVRRCVRAGFLAARRLSDGDVRLSFQDLVLLRRAAELVSSRVRPHSVRRALTHLRQQLPEGRPLSGVHVSVEGRAIVAREGESLWDPLSRQMHLNFQTSSQVALSAAPLSAFAGPSSQDLLRAERDYEHGCALDEHAPREAMAAYRRALDALPNHVDARINLGRLLHESGDVEGAAAEYRRALEAGPQALASFNLGVALEDLLQVDAAILAYQDAIRADAGCEDAYFNLARIYERRGERAAALRALRTYRSLTQRT